MYTKPQILLLSEILATLYKEIYILTCMSSPATLPNPRGNILYVNCYVYWWVIPKGVDDMIGIRQLVV